MTERTGIGQRIRDERKAAGYTQAELAQIVGIDNTTLSRIEQGTRTLDSLTLRRISRALDVPMDRFFEESEVAVFARAGTSDDQKEMVDWARAMKADVAFVRQEAANRYG